MRSVIAGGIALTTRLRRSPAPQSGSSPPVTQDAPKPPTATQAPRRKRTAAPKPGHPDDTESPFTPEAFPGLPPELCALLDTPIEACDPELLLAVLAVFAQAIAGKLPSELGLDAEALFATFCDRFGTTPAQLGLEAAPPEQPPAFPEHQLQPPPAGPSDDAIHAPIAARQTAPGAPARPVPARLRSRAKLRGSHHLRCTRRSGALRARSVALHRPPPQRRLSYAACAGPP